jgi:hypothetical protein
MTTFVNTAPKRRSSITQVYQSDDLDRVESLRSSLADLRDSFQALAAEVQEEEASVQRMRTSSQAKLAAGAAVQREEYKRKKSVVLEGVAAAGTEKLEQLEAVDGRRRMSLVAAEAAGNVDDPDAHHDGCPETSKDPIVVPDWQAEGRTRGASVAQEVASHASNKAEVKRRGSMNAMEATKMAVFRGTADHE